MAPRKQRSTQPTTSTPVDANQSGDNDNMSMLSQNLNQVTQMIANLTQNVSSLASSTIAASSVPSSSRRAIGLNAPIPPYDPADEVSSIEQFISKIDQLASIHNWEEQTVIYMATSNLQGLAKTWYNSQKRLDYSWEEWKEVLRSAFPEEVDYQSLLFKILNRTKKPDEEMIVYYYEKMALIESFNFEDKVAVNLLIGGLTNTEIAAAAKAGRHETPASLLQFLKGFKKDSRPMKNNVKKFVGSAKHKPYHRHMQAGVVKCYHCNKVGHIAPYCPNKKPSSSKVVLATKNDQVNLNKKYFLDARLNGHCVRAFVDFGSSVMLLTKSTAELLKVDILKKPEFIRGYGGGVVKSLGGTSKILVAIDECEGFLEFLVVPDEVQNIPVIIGQPFTELPEVTVYKTNETLRFLKNQSKCVLHTSVDTIIPPNYVGYVNCYSDTTGDVYLDGSLRLKEGEECEIPRCVLSIRKNKTCRVPVTNLGNHDLVIRENKILARGYNCKLEDAERINNDSTDREPLTEADINIDSKLARDEKEKAINLINRYRNCFATSLEEIGCSKSTKMKIKLNSEKPITYRPYRMAYVEREKVKDMVNEMKGAGIIRDSDSSYSSPILLVNKPNGEKRMCIDYRKLNEVTEKDRHPLPLIDDQIDRLKGFKYYSTLDLFSGYYQVEMEEESKNKTAFVTCDGQYEFNRMPFGLTNAPSVFQRLINRVLGPLHGLIAIAYLDDILCPSKTFEEGLDNLEKVFKTLLDNNLTLNPSKCHFFKTEISYLGFDITQDGVKPGVAKTKAVKEFPVPKNVHNVRQFLGLTGFFRRFVEKYAYIAKPLSMLLHKGQAWIWSEEQENAFRTLKEKLIQRPILAIYDSKRETEVHTDACQYGIAGMLLQKVQGTLRAVGYFSRQLTAAESKWHSYELETLAVVETLKRYRVYLLGLEFLVVTDCSAIKSAAAKKDVVPKIARWWLQLLEFTFKIEHRKGQGMLHVDALSRNPTDEVATTSENFIFRIETEDWILAGQMTDKQLQAMHGILKKTPTDEFEKRIHKEYKLTDNRLFKKVNGRELWVVPKNMRREVVRSCHDEFGHFSVEKTLRKLLECYWFPKMNRYVTKYIASCVRCLYTKTPRGKQEGRMCIMEKPSVPFDTIHVDHMGPFNRSSAGKRYVLVVIDAFTKYINLIGTKDTKTVPAVRFLNQLITTFGVPTKIISDRGACFTSRAFKNFCWKIGSKHIMNAVATPRANGQIERYNATILSALTATISDEREWEKKLPQVQFAMNNTVNTTTGKTPSELLMGYRPRGVSDAPLTVEIQKDRPTTSNLFESRKVASARTRVAQEKSKERYDRKRKTPKEYREGELVLVKKQRTGEGSKKLLPHYKGPFKIVKTLPNDRYILEEIEGSHRSKRAPYKNVEAVDKLKKWVPETGISSSSSDNETESDLPGKFLFPTTIEPVKNVIARGRTICQDGRLLE